MNRDEMRQRARARSVERLRSGVLFDQTAEIQRPVTIGDGLGGQTTTWETVATVPCRVVPGGTQPRDSVGGEVAAGPWMASPRVSTIQTWVVSVPVDTDIRPQDRLIVDTRAFEVVAPLGPRSDEVRTRVACVEIT